MRCRPNDLAVVISAVNESNIGRIVRVLRPYDGTGGLVLLGEGPQWLISSSEPTIWGIPGKTRMYLRTQGPALDSQLQPIRGLTGDSAADVTSDADEVLTCDLFGDESEEDFGEYVEADTAAQYEVWYIDIFDYPSESWGGTKFASAAEAIAHATKVITDFLEDAYEPGMTEKDLYGNFMTFGESCIVVAREGAADVHFRGSEVARVESSRIVSRHDQRPFNQTSGS